MARDAVAVTDLSLNGGVAEVAGTTISVANGASIDAGYTDNLLIVMKNTSAAQRVYTIPAGVGPTAAAVTVTLAADTGVQFVTVESAKVVQADGKIYIDFAASSAGTVQAYRLPAGV